MTQYFDRQGEVRAATVIEAGPPFVARARINQTSSGSERIVHFDMVIIGKSGETYDQGICRGRVRMSSMQCRIIDEDKRIVAAGTVEYG